MDKAHIINRVAVSGNLLHLDVDGVSYKVDLASQSSRLAEATQAEREQVEVSPSGYGLHWPALDEDLSVDGLIGVTHRCPFITAST